MVALSTMYCCQMDGLRLNATDLLAHLTANPTHIAIPYQVGQ